MEPKNHVIRFTDPYQPSPRWKVADDWGKEHGISFNYTLTDDWRFETQEDATFFKLTFGGTYHDVLQEG